MNHRDVHRFDRLHQVREVEEQRCRQDLMAANAALRAAAAFRDQARLAAGQQPGNGVRDLAVFRTEIQMARLRTEQLAAAQDQVRLAELAVVTAHGAWTMAARRVQGLDKLVERRRAAQQAELLLEEAHEQQDMFQSRRLADSR
jgi:flagellar biosynthesis chaperone FliJ